jgi:aspartyl-tRNA(Asn)/glutamyl-tRNA(Gln) amidotransferase subunit A
MTAAAAFDVERARAIDAKVGAFLRFTPERAAAAAGREGKLAGFTVALKDNICTRGIPTTAASKILEGYIPPYDATVVERLEKAGAAIVGKTNLDEFAMGSSTENSALGKTRNPWALDRVPGGSSGGSAAAVAAGLCRVALGSDTGGSIRQPAALCGVVGFKPTYGLVSRYGLLAFASSLDQIGPFGRTVPDVARVMDAIAGHDPRDSTSIPERPPSFTHALEDSPSGFRIGLPREYFSATAEAGVREAVLAAVKRYEHLGVQVVDVSLPHTDYGIATYYIVATAEASSNLARYDGVHYGHRTAKADDIVDLYARSRGEGFGAEVKRRIFLGTYVLSSGFYDAYYIKALKVRTLIRRDFAKAFEECDVIACPTSPTVAFKMGERSMDPLLMYAADVYTVAANLAGIPGISIPCGLSEGLPVGLQLMGPAGSDPLLFRFARAYEKEVGGFAVPPS